MSQNGVFITFDKNTRPISRKNDLQSLIYTSLQENHLDQAKITTSPWIFAAEKGPREPYFKPDPKNRLNFIRNGNVLTLSCISIFYI